MSGLRSAIDELAGEDLTGADPLVLAADLVELQRQRDRLEGELLRRLAVFDGRRMSEEFGAQSTQGWLRGHLRLDAGAAVTLVRTARQLRNLPATAAALADGQITAGHAHQLARAVADVGVVLEGADEALLVAQARTLDGTQFRRLLGSWRQVVDPDGRLADADRASTRRRLTLTPCYDGSVAVNGRLDAEGGATVIAALRALAEADRVPGELRGASEARADALVGLCRQALDGGLPECDGERPHLDVTISWAWLAGHTDPDSACALPDVGPIPAETARRLACDAGVSRVVTDPAGLPLDIGRRAATPTTGQRRALKHRDRGCRFPGCTRRRRLQAHHVRFWARDTGPTNLDNLVLLCWWCHRLVHEDGWTLTYHPATNTTRAISPTGLTLHGPAPPPTG